MKEFIGTMYFESGRDKEDRPCSVYKGVVVGFVVRDDTGKESVYRDETILPVKRRAMSYTDCKYLKEGQPVMKVGTEEVFIVTKVYPQTAEVWVKDDAGKSHALKITELRRVSV